MKIEQCVKISIDELSCINKLLVQLLPEAKTLSMDDMTKLLGQKNYFLFVARENELIVGMATIVLYAITTGMKATIEDVVVDKKYRGQGIGEKLMQGLISFARQSGVKYIDLTSGPSRIAANKLYQKLGFEKRETNVYRMKS